MPNFSSLAGLEVCGVVGWGGVVEHLTTVSNSNASCFRVGLSRVELRWVLTICLLIFSYGMCSKIFIATERGSQSSNIEMSESI